MQALYPDLKGRTALVTGASSGIGHGIAEALLGQGMRVVLQYKTHAPEARSLAARFQGAGFPFRASLSTEQGCVDLSRYTRESLGKVDLFVHSAGIWNDGPIETLSAETLEEMFRVNTFSAFYLVRELVPALRPKGNIVLIGSTAGERGEAGHSHYAASKGALQSLVMSLAVELAPQIRTNLVSPGWVRTQMAEQALQRIGPALIPTLPNKRVAEVDDIVNAVLYLASDASGHVLGQTISVSGGALLVVPRGQLKVAE
jgi:3-oxoacyl-[acyl-carrier protein] reductase